MENLENPLEEKPQETVVTETPKTTEQESKPENALPPEKKERRLKKIKIKISLKKLFYVAIGVVVIGAILVAYFWGPAISRSFNSSNNKYGFDYNFDKIRDYDWDSLLTEKKISSAMKAPGQQLNTIKNPDYSWALDAPQELATKIICASILEEKVLYEISATENNLFTVSVMLCNTTKKTEEYFSARENNVSLVVAQDETLKLEKMQKIKNLGKDSYEYLISKTNKAEDGTESKEKYGGTIFYRGPLLVRIEETEVSTDITKVSSGEMRNSLADYIDTELKKAVSIF